MNEIWKPIPRFNNQYLVSSFGRIKSVDGVVIKRDGRKYTRKSRILKPCKNHSGYLAGAVCINGKITAYQIHRIVAEIFVCGQEDGFEVNHKNAIKTDNRAENLEWVSKLQNVRHATEMGLQRARVGSLNGMAKLTEEQVREIRSVAERGGRYYGRKELAEKYGVSECTIKEVVTRRKNKFYNA